MRIWLCTRKEYSKVMALVELAGEDARHVFYHHSESIDSLSTDADAPVALPCYESEPDGEGFCKGKVGDHTFPFNMQLPLQRGAKGGLKCKQGIVKYIVIGSVKLKSHLGTDRSIAHFYRHVEVYPYLAPSILLAPSVKSVSVEASKAIFMGGQGKVKVVATLHRSAWVAGQRCYIDVRVHNGTAKKVRLLHITNLRIAHLPSCRSKL